MEEGPASSGSRSSVDSKGLRKGPAKARMAHGVLGERFSGALASLGNEVTETRLSLPSIPVPTLFFPAPRLPLCPGLNSVPQRPLRLEPQKVTFFGKSVRKHISQR